MFPGSAGVLPGNAGGGFTTGGTLPGNPGGVVCVGNCGGTPGAVGDVPGNVGNAPGSPAFGGTVFGKLVRPRATLVNGCARFVSANTVFGFVGVIVGTGWPPPTMPRPPFTCAIAAAHRSEEKSTIRVFMIHDSAPHVPKRAPGIPCITRANARQGVDVLRRFASYPSQNAASALG
jgi:hypothetical protein